MRPGTSIASTVAFTSEAQLLNAPLLTRLARLLDEREFSGLLYSRNELRKDVAVHPWSLGQIGQSK